MSINTALLVVLLVLPACYAVDYTVGDANGWNQGVNYASWTSGKTFNVGDRLLFNYGGSHSVDVVSKSDHDNCATGNALQSYSDGSTSIPLNNTGSMYFICPVFGHCSGGMKLAVTVSAGSTTPTTPGGATPTPTTPGSATPTPTTPGGATPTPTTPGRATPSPTTPSPSTPSSRTPSSTTPNGASNNLFNIYFMGIAVCAMYAFIG